MPDKSTTPLVCDLSSLALISFSGSDAQTFLHNQLSCDVSVLTPETSTYGSYCTPKGRMLATFLLWRSGDDYLMQLPSALREAIQKRLSTFILRSKVKAADASNEWIKLGLAGKGAAALIGRSFGQVPQAAHGVAHLDETTIIRLPGDRFEIVAPKHKAPIIMETLAGEADMAEPEYWDWLDIRAGVPVITPATQEQFVPQMANLDLIGGVSFTKGCYPGQEIVSRTYHRGTLKQRMYLANLMVEERPQAGDKLYSTATGEQSCGMIVNAARSPGDGYDALAVIQIAAAARGEVRWKAPDGPPLELMPLPYSLPEAG
jgi:folate-binding protein YgfZ